MKKKIQRRLFFLVFIVGIIAGILIPTDLIKEKLQSGVKSEVIDIPKKFGQLDNDAGSFKYAVIEKTSGGSISLIRVDDEIKTHVINSADNFFYVNKGRVVINISGVNYEAGPGQIISIPAGSPRSIKRIGDSPVELILFSVPPFEKENIIFSSS